MDEKTIKYNLKVGEIEKIIAEIIRDLEIDPKTVANHIIQTAYYGMMRYVPNSEQTAFQAYLEGKMLGMMRSDLA